MPPDVCKGQIDLLELSKVEKVETNEEKEIRLARERMPKLDEMYNSFDFEGIMIIYIHIYFIIYNLFILAVAQTVLKSDAWAYYSSGADDEIGMRENHSAFQRIWFKPRVMVNVKQVNPSTRMLGSFSSFPLYITATALGKLGHPEGELVLTRAAAKRNVIQMIPTLASCSFDEIIDASQPNQSQWLQLYVNSDRNVSEKFIRHAEKRGVKALFITADAPQLGK